MDLGNLNRPQICYYTVNTSYSKRKVQNTKTKFSVAPNSLVYSLFPSKKHTFLLILEQLVHTELHNEY